MTWMVADEQLAEAVATLAHELAGGPTVAHTATRVPVTIAINEGVGVADMAMTELQKPIFLSEDFRWSWFSKPVNQEQEPRSNLLC
jgi:hypothetical protein